MIVKQYITIVFVNQVVHSKIVCESIEFELLQKRNCTIYFFTMKKIELRRSSAVNLKKKQN